MHKYSQICWLIMAMLLLTGCAPSPAELGLTAQEWQQMNTQKQQEVLAHYEQIRQKQQSLYTVAQIDTWLKITIMQGTIMMPPFDTDYVYQPVNFQVFPNSCRDVTVYSLTGDRQVVLTACYKDDVLFLDPSRYELNKQPGSIRFYASPLWRSGFLYSHITSSGYVRLRDVDVRIKRQQGHD